MIKFRGLIFHFFNNDKNGFCINKFSIKHKYKNEYLTFAHDMAILVKLE